MRPDLSYPPSPEIRASLRIPRFFMSSKMRIAAMRSVWGVLKTHFFTGSTISTPPAREMNGTPAFSTSGTAAMVSPVLEPPTMTSTPSFWMSRLTKVTASFAWPTVS